MPIRGHEYNLKMEVTMEVMIQSRHFDTTEKLQAFIEKKVAKLEKSFEDIKKVDVMLKVVKPATALNKETSMTVTVPGGGPLYVEKTCDTFEEGVDQCVDALRVKLEKFKEKMRNH
ncbi:ribosomal subunit interface protein [Hallella bergensis DSM 17361]|uniref:Ribosome hibernation promoting factor n=2 Tax=Hallella bergensis TaxID=242750 RepID=D1PZN9_9BACT|nr:ribosomal subunit interface protein [Hallella bergensis DSM 17361]